MYYSEKKREQSEWRLKKNFSPFPTSMKRDGWFSCHGDIGYMEFRKSISNVAASHYMLSGRGEWLSLGFIFIKENFSYKHSWMSCSLSSGPVTNPCSCDLSPAWRLMTQASISMLKCDYCGSQMRYNLDRPRICLHSPCWSKRCWRLGTVTKGPADKSVCATKYSQDRHIHTLSLMWFAWASKNTLKRFPVFLYSSYTVSLRIKGGAWAMSNTTTKTTSRCTEEQLLILQCEFQTASHPH